MISHTDWVGHLSSAGHVRIRVLAGGQHFLVVASTRAQDHGANNDKHNTDAGNYTSHISNWWKRSGKHAHTHTCD